MRTRRWMTRLFESTIIGLVRNCHKSRHDGRNGIAQCLRRLVPICLVIFGTVTLSCLFLQAYLSSIDSNVKSSVKKNVLLVVAHPDDECLFFGPSVRCLVQSPDHELFIACLSIGDNYHKGDRKRVEFFLSCKTLGIKRDNIRLLNHKRLLSREDAPEDLKAYALVTVGLHVRRMISVLDLPYSYMNSDLMYTVWLNDVFTAQRAFLLDNKSQFHKNRLFWILTTPYMICNPLVRIRPEIAQLSEFRQNRHGIL